MVLLSAIGCTNSNDSEKPSTVGTVYGKVSFPETDTSILRTNSTAANENLGRTQVYLDGEKTEITDLNGNFEFNNIKSGTHTFKIKDKYYYSKKYKVEIKEKDTQIALQAKIGGVFPNLYYLSGNSKPRLTLEIKLAPEIEKKIKNDDYKLKVLYKKDNKYVSIGAYKDDYWLRGSVFVNEIFNVNKRYEIKVKVLKGDKIKRQFKKNIVYYDIKLKFPENEVNKNNPTFTWKKIDDTVAYKLDLYYWNENYKNWNLLSLNDNDKLVDNTYTLQVNETDKSKWQSGNKYKWNIKTFLYDKAGHCWGEFESAKWVFDYK